jgi:hypothetical protein
MMPSCTLWRVAPVSCALAAHAFAFACDARDCCRENASAAKPGMGPTRMTPAHQRLRGKLYQQMGFRPAFATSPSVAIRKLASVTD